MKTIKSKATLESTMKGEVMLVIDKAGIAKQRRDFRRKTNSLPELIEIEMPFDMRVYGIPVKFI